MARGKKRTSKKKTTRSSKRSTRTTSKKSVRKKPVRKKVRKPARKAAKKPRSKKPAKSTGSSTIRPTKRKIKSQVTYVRREKEEAHSLVHDFLHAPETLSKNGLAGWSKRYREKWARQSKKTIFDLYILSVLLFVLFEALAIVWDASSNVLPTALFSSVITVTVFIVLVGILFYFREVSLLHSRVLMYAIPLLAYVLTSNFVSLSVQFLTYTLITFCAFPLYWDHAKKPNFTLLVTLVAMVFVLGLGLHIADDFYGQKDLIVPLGNCENTANLSESYVSCEGINNRSIAGFEINCQVKGGNFTPTQGTIIVTYQNGNPVEKGFQGHPFTFVAPMGIERIKFVTYSQATHEPYCLKGNLPYRFPTYEEYQKNREREVGFFLALFFATLITVPRFIKVIKDLK